MRDFFETVRHRHSIRRYQPDMPLEDEKLHAILESACAAPSAGDLQAYRIVVVRDPGHRAALGRAAGGQDFIAEAPVNLVFAADPACSAQEYGERGRDLYAVQDTTIAAAYAQLAAAAADVSSAWVGSFDEAAVREAAGLEPSLVPVAILCLGYPAELPEATPRRRLDEVVRYL